jgi:uncharacterized protein
MGQLVQIADLSSAPRPAGGVRAYHVMIKPGGSICNLNCAYCFYLHKKELLGGSQTRFRIPDEILEEHIRQYTDGQDAAEIVFTWQGGEPTLLGLDFFEKVVELEKKYKKPHQRIENDLQTNGTLLNNEWAAFLKQNGFFVGLSIDGPREQHDAFRVSNDGSATFAKVYAAAQTLHRHGVPFNSLTVVNRLNARRPKDVYRFLRDEVAPREMQFIPCVEPRNFRTVAPQKADPDSLPVFNSPAAHPGNPDSVVTDWSVDPDDWGYFLCRVWDDWLRHDYGKVFVNLFETAIAQWMGRDAQICVYHEFCGKGLALEHDGSVYSCDHYVYPEYKLGNILETSSSRMVFSQRQMDFGLSKFGSLPGRCRDCDYLFACNGECPKNRLIRTPAGEPGLNYLCSGLLRFWNHIDEEAKEIARCIARGETYKRRRT